MSENEDHIRLVIDNADAVVLDQAAIVDNLSRLKPFDYEMRRKDAAQQLGVRVGALDETVRARRDSDRDHGNRLSLPEIEPWNDPVSGEELLADLVATIERHLVLGNGTAVTIALWAIHTHVFHLFTVTPRLAITSPEMRCGKTTLLDILGTFVARPLQAANITAAATYRTIALAQPTLLVDEADTFLNKSNDLRGILNAGHRKGGVVVRLQGENHEPVKFSAWSPVAIAAIGRLPSTLADRSIEIRMRRRRPYEKIERLRTDRMEAFRVLARKIARWASDNAVAVSTVDPEIPELMSDRAADNWRSLLAIAEVIGGEWLARAKSAALILAKAGAQAGHSEGVQLLKDIRTFINERKCESYFAETLVQYLVHLEERPWAEFRNNRPLTKTQLAKMLTAYRISSGTIRIGDKTAKGYYAERFKGAFGRYLPAETVTPSHPAQDLDKS